MQRRDVWAATILTLCTIWVITRMVPAHAQDASDDTGYPYGTPTESVFIETPYPTMTEMVVPDNASGDAPTQTPATDLTTTPTPTMTDTPTPFLEPVGTPTITPAEGTDVTIIDPTPSDLLATRELPQSVEALAPTAAVPLQCHTDATIVVSGFTKPWTMLLLRFDTRVVGGGMSDATGRYDIPVRIGTEATGTHLLQVIARQDGRHLQQVTCDTP